VQDTTAYSPFRECEYRNAKKTDPSTVASASGWGSARVQTVHTVAFLARKSDAQMPARRLWVSACAIAYVAKHAQAPARLEHSDAANAGVPNGTTCVRAYEDKI
jgi:hypothetical protein